MSGTQAPERKPRSDAVRNRSNILDVAESYFAQHGITGSLDAIAKQAGIGAGTLYRHFPNRDALLAALMRSRDDRLVETRDAIRQDTEPVAALAAWLAALVEWASAFDGLPEPLRLAVDEEASPLALTCQGYITTTDEFLRDAQAAGGARADVHARDLFLGMLATSWIRTAAMADQTSAAAIRTLIQNGWATQAGYPEPAAAPLPDKSPPTAGLSETRVRK